MDNEKIIERNRFSLGHALIIHPEMPPTEWILDRINLTMDSTNLRDVYDHLKYKDKNFEWRNIPVVRATHFSGKRDLFERKVRKDIIYLQMYDEIKRVIGVCERCGNFRWYSPTYRWCGEGCREGRSLLFAEFAIEEDAPVVDAANSGELEHPTDYFVFTGKRPYFYPTCDACGELIEVGRVFEVYTGRQRPRTAAHGMPSLQKCCCVFGVRKRKRVLVHKEDNCLRKMGWHIKECPGCGEEHVAWYKTQIIYCSDGCKSLSNAKQKSNKPRLDLNPETFTEEVRNVC